MGPDNKFTAGKLNYNFGNHKNIKNILEYRLWSRIYLGSHLLSLKLFDSLKHKTVTPSFKDCFEV